MTPELRKTLAFVVVAILLTGAAYLSVADRSATHTAFDDPGPPFFPDFKDPLACTDLEVVDYESSTASRRPFKVMLKDGKWVIPSHHDYPADAKDRLAKTSAGVIDLTKDTIKSDRVEDQEAFGVLDPTDDKVTAFQGLGKLVRLRDKTQKILAEFIIGKEVRDRSGQRYVRVPGQKRTYGVNVKVDLSTRFADWIETNLLKAESSRVRSVRFDNHKVDPEAGRIIPGETLTIDKAGDTAPWTFQGEIPAGSELNTEKISAMTTALADLKIIGVRPKPEGLSRDLKVAKSGDVKPSNRAELNSLISKGFYPTPQGFYSNQGDVVFRTDEGAVYTLRFGEVVFATGEQLSAGGKDEGKDAAKKAEGATESRYLLVTVAFDSSLVPEPAKPKEQQAIPDDPFQKAPNDPKRVAEEEAARKKFEGEKADRERRIAEAGKKVKALSDRFADWYYVTPGDSFRTIALDRAALMRPKSDKPDNASPGGTPSGFPGGLPPGFPGGMPPGFQHP